MTLIHFFIYSILDPKANLEINKGGLAADLVCMLDERSLPRYKAKFEAEIEGFFIAGAARIDLIAKVVDLDNFIGGNNFDILNLEETSNAIGSLSESGGKHHCACLIVYNEEMSLPIQLRYCYTAGVFVATTRPFIG